MDLTSRELIVGVVSSLIATFLIFVLTPLLRKFGTWGVNLASARNKKFRDSLYRRASHRTVPYSADSRIITVGIFGFVALASSGIIKAPNASGDVPPAYFGVFIMVYIFSFMIWFFIRVLVRQRVLNIIRRFENTIRFIRPYTLERDIHLMERNWIMMSTYEDFLKIRARLDKLEGISNKKANAETGE